MQSEERWQGRVYTAPSRIHGTGLFAARDYEASDVIFVRDESREVTPQKPLLPGENEWHCDWLEAGRQVLLPHPDRHMNHSCDPNSYVDFSQGSGRIIAIKPIGNGHEITNSYSVNLAGGEAWDCNCQSARCLKRVPGEFFELPLERQIELMPYLAGWFIREHRERHEALKRQAGLA